MDKIYNSVTCDEEEIFLLTQLGYDKMPLSMREAYKPGKPMKGFEQVVPENLYVRGYFEKVDKEECDDE